VHGSRMNRNSIDCLAGNVLLAPEERVILTYTLLQLVSYPDLSAIGWSGDETIQLRGLHTQRIVWVQSTSTPVVCMM